MSEKVGGARINHVIPNHRQEQLKEKNIKRHVLREHQKEVHEEKLLQEDLRAFNEITAEQFFPKGEEGLRTLHQSARTVSADILELYESGLTDAGIASDAVKASNLAGEELEALLSTIDENGEKKDKFDKLATDLLSAGEGQEEGLIDNAARTICSHKKSEIYLMLCYLLDDLVRKKAKEKLQDRLKKIIDTFERQESAYLFNFFSFQSILKNSPNSSIDASMLDKMANISSGHVKLNSLRQSLQFVAQSLPDEEMYKMVSIFMKFQGRNLKRITTLSEGREGKEQIANILQQERNLIILNSLYNQCKKLFVNIKKVFPIEEKYADFMMQVITVIESSMVSLDGLQNMERLLGVQQITLEINRVFIKSFESLLSKMPQPIFYNEAMRDKLLESLKSIIRSIDKLQEAPSTGLSFLTKKGTRKEAPRIPKKNAQYT